jgi:peptide/nickel transport system substrate-binding protein
VLRTGRIKVVLTLAAVSLAACTGGSHPAAPRSSTVPSAARGGTFRAAVEDLRFTDGFDPTGESSRLGMGLQSELLLRTLVTYRHVAGPAGVQPVPDLATDTGRVSPDGLAWTFHLKDGVRFGPPVNRSITSSDVEFAFRRIATAALNPELGAYGVPPSTSAIDTAFDGVVESMTGGMSSMPDGISGIDSSDPRTVVFHLSRPEGAFPSLLSLPATAPVPPEIAGCFHKAGGYGRDVVSTGPYMVQGANEVDASSCRSLVAMRGFLPTRHLRLVRNPNYDPSTDDPAIRENFPDQIDIEIDPNAEQILRDLDSGREDATLGSISAFAPFPPDLRSHAHRETIEALSYLTMNVLVPPFDDIHVRRAVDVVLDRTELLRALGASGQGAMAGQLFPPFLLPSAGSLPASPHSDLDAARGEMSLSRYDANHDGVCDADACRNVLFIGRTTPPDVNARPVLQQELDQIGIHLVIRELDPGTAYTTIQTVRNLVPIALHTTELAYADPEALADSLRSSGISCENQINYSEVGITRLQAGECGVLKQWKKVRDDIPNVDSRIDACRGLGGDPRSACWAEFDRYVMTDVVPWAPIRFPDTLIVTGRTVTKFEYDQAFGILSLCHVAVATAGT